MDQCDILYTRKCVWLPQCRLTNDILLIRKVRFGETVLSSANGTFVCFSLKLLTGCHQINSSVDHYYFTLLLLEYSGVT